MKIREIEIFEVSNNKKGDLFSRLIGDVFHCLGYSDPRYDIHKSGREIDITAEHRTENKVAIAECKAHKNTIGGADLNKFAGALESERNQIIAAREGLSKPDVVGYFVSMSGFKETGVEQENNNNNRMILLDSKKIIEELICGKIIVSTEQAINNIPSVDKVELLDYADLIASDAGWVWVFYYGSKQETSHFSFIHAEGKPLVNALARKLITIDKKLSKKFAGLEYIAPKEVDSLAKQAKEKYFKYIENECGEIQFEGLPTDKDAGSVKVKLEKIFEPLHLEKVETDRDSDFDKERESVGAILSKNNRLAILAKPGGGKSTLIKRVAVAYAFPRKRKLVNDNLPNKKLFPIFIRCRELGSKVSFSITEIINDIPNFAEIGGLQEGFKSILSEALQSGNALLLIDGLDEISADKDRIGFVNQLRRFLSTYPKISIITTSRIAGFRAVGGILADYCKQYEVSSLNQKEIRSLSDKWHKAIIDDSQGTLNESKELCDQILADSRIISLAENPLLLTTLLFVKRWAGYLPTKRHILYQEMIKLLLVTWNVEGHDQLDIDETEPQLAFVAFWMTQNGQQTITERELKKCLLEARKQMPDILGYTNISVPDFIKRVESRSSLLIMSGHKQLEDASIVPLYEFLHLSFQEYLTAKAVVEKSIPENMHNSSNLNILEKYIFKENWKEVIPLVAVLSKRDNRELIEYLIEKSKYIPEKKERAQSNAPSLLGSCIANEIQIAPALLKSALEWYSKNKYALLDQRNIEIISHGKFSNTLKEVLEDKFFNEYEDKFSSAIGGMLGEISGIKSKGLGSKLRLDKIKTTILGDTKELSCIGILELMQYAFEQSGSENENSDFLDVVSSVSPKLLELMRTGEQQFLYSISWALAWIHSNKFIRAKIKVNDDLVIELIKNWFQSEGANLSRMSAWGLSVTFHESGSILKYIRNVDSYKERILSKYKNKENEFDELVAIYLGTEVNIKWATEELEKTFREKERSIKNNDLYKYYKKKLGVKDKRKVVQGTLLEEE